MLLSAAMMALSCQSVSTTNYPENLNRREYLVDAPGGKYKVSHFPKTYSAVLGPSFSLVVVSPVLFTDEILYNSGSSSTIPWFNARGVDVWYVHVPPHMNLEKFGREVLPQVTIAIRKNSANSEWVMAGISLGGQAVAHYLADAPRHATISGISFKSAFFLGTGFDYVYPDSFTVRLKDQLAANPNDPCAADFCARNYGAIGVRHISAPSNLADETGAPVWRESMKTVSLRECGVRLMFIAGKIDNVAPSETVYKYFAQTIGDATRNSTAFIFKQPGRMNAQTRDYDHSMLLASDDLQSEILPEILRWIEM
jgi:pimeloyl-ACP methyl ester carboxylesterase